MQKLGAILIIFTMHAVGVMAANHESYSAELEKIDNVRDELIIHQFIHPSDKKVATLIDELNEAKLDLIADHYAIDLNRERVPSRVANRTNKLFMSVAPGISQIRDGHLRINGPGFTERFETDYKREAFISAAFESDSYKNTRLEIAASHQRNTGSYTIAADTVEFLDDLIYDDGPDGYSDIVVEDHEVTLTTVGIHISHGREYTKCRPYVCVGAGIAFIDVDGDDSVEPSFNIGAGLDFKLKEDVIFYVKCDHHFISDAEYTYSAPADIFLEEFFTDDLRIDAELKLRLSQLTVGYKVAF